MDRAALFSIGEFSQITNVNIKSLRYYEKLGILIPAWTDPSNGYRYYDIRQLQMVDLIGIFIDLEIQLNHFFDFFDTASKTIDLVKVLEHGRISTRNKIKLLENKMRYIDFLEEMTIAKGNSIDFQNSSCPLWLMPVERGAKIYQMEWALKKMLHEIKHYGLKFSNNYGLIMFCNGSEQRVYYFIDLKLSSTQKIIHENIFYLPDGNYKTINQSKWNIHTAPKIFKDLFALDYDKIIIQTSGSDSIYPLNCLLPLEDKEKNLPR